MNFEELSANKKILLISEKIFGDYYGSPNWIRTNDLPVNSRLLYRWAIGEYVCYGSPDWIRTITDREFL